MNTAQEMIRIYRRAVRSLFELEAREDVKKNWIADKRNQLQGMEEILGLIPSECQVIYQEEKALIFTVAECSSQFAR